MSDSTSAKIQGDTATAGPVTCAACAAVCCRLEVLCLTETGVPRRYLCPNPAGVHTMDRLDDGWCAALSRDTLLCTIYENRPLICRELEAGGPECLAIRADWAATLENGEA
jgi:Fe-S-cluster containining protein